LAGGLTPEMRSSLEAMGFRPKKHLGQNFMRDGNMIATLARAAGVKAGEIVLEPGPGAGALTAELLQIGAEVFAVELDPMLVQYLQQRFSEHPGFELLQADILGKGRRLNPLILSKLNKRPFVLASNLPYSAATPFLISLVGSELLWQRGAVTIQREVAERLSAPAGTSKYGAASALLQLRAKVRLERNIPPEVFWPRPKIESSILVIEPLTQPSVASAEMDSLAAFLRGLFSARRKSLPKALLSAGVVKNQVFPAIEETGFNPKSRPAELSPSDLARLWRITRQA